MRRIFKKKISIFGREVSVFLIALIAIVGFGSAALLSYYGKIDQTVIIGGAAVFSGGNCNGDGYCTEDLGTINACESATSDIYKIESQTGAIIPLDILTEITPPEDDIDMTVEYLLDNSGGSCPGDTCEKRIFINAEDIGINTLSDLDSISWDVNVIEGYIAHVDVLIDTDGDGVKDDALVFEYAKVDSAHCDETPYPTGEMNTFGDLGSVDNDARAWLTTGPAGACSSPPTVFFWHTLSSWKAGVDSSEANGKTINGDTPIIGFEIEVDNWIEDSNSNIKNILINGNPVEISLKPSDELSFDTIAEINCLINTQGTYTLTTTVTAR